MSGALARHMKRLAELTAEDFRETAVWLSRGSSDSDAMVSPTDLQEVGEDTEVVLLATTEFRLADGTVLTGFCSPSDPSGLDYVQPVICTHIGQIALWTESLPTKAAMAATWKRLGKRLDQVFPLKYRCLVPVDTQEVSGEVTIDEATAG